MKIIEFSREYQTAIQQYCLNKDIPSNLLNAKFQWVDEPGIARSELRYLRFMIVERQIILDISRMCETLQIPISFLNLTRGNKAFTIAPEYLPLIADYCEQVRVDYDSLMEKIKVEENVAIPEIPNQTHISVRSLKMNKVYDTVYAPKLLKYLRDPSYGTWIYASELYRDTIEVTAELFELNWDFLNKHIAWIKDEEDTFHVTELGRVALYVEGKYKYLNLAHFKNVALGEEPL